MSEKNGKKKLRLFGIPAILPFVKELRGKLALMAVCSLLGTALDVLTPVYQRYALDEMVGRSDLSRLPWFIAVYVISILACSVMNYISCTLATANEVRINARLRDRVFHHLQTLSFSFYNQNSVGVIHSRVMSDTSRIGTLFSWTLMESIFHLTYLVGAVLVMLVIDARLGLLVMSVLPVIFVLFSVFQSHLVRVNRQIRETNAQITGDFNEGITGAKTVKTLVIEEKLECEFVKGTSHMRERSVRAAQLRGLFSVTTNLASSCALAIVLWQGGLIAADQVGTYSMFMSYAQGMMEPVRWLIDAVSDLIMTRVNIERYTDLMATTSDVTDTP